MQVIYEYFFTPSRGKRHNYSTIRAHKTKLNIKLRKRLNNYNNNPC